MAWNIDMPSAEYFDHDSAGLGQLIQDVMMQPEVAIDSETTGLNVMKDIPLFWSLSWGERRICMPASTLHRFAPVFADTKKKWFLANAKFDMHMFAQVGLHLQGKVLDTQVMHALIYEEQPHDLKYMAKQILGWGWRDFFDTFDPRQILVEQKESNDEGALGQEPDFDEDAPKKRRKKKPQTRDETIGEMLTRFHQEDRQTLVEYASNDAYGTYMIGKKLEQQLKDEATWSLYPDEFQSMWDIFWKTEVPFTKVLWKCERNGILIDVDYLKKVQGPVEENMASIEREIAKITGRVINLKSRDELAHYFFDEKGYRATKMTKGGKSGVKKKALDYDVLKDLAAQQQDPVAKKVLEYRDLDKLHGTYILGLAKHLDANNRIHCRLNQDIARTGRLSSSNPNCFHPDTEVLTPSGWVAISKLQVGIPVAQWSISGVVNFVAPTAYTKQAADGLIELENQHIRLAVTRDHRCLLRHRKTMELRTFPAADYPEDWQQIHAGRFLGGTLQYGENFIRLLVAVQADGYIGRSGIDFGLKKPRKVKRLLDIINSLGVEHRYTPSDSRGRARIYLKACDVTKEVISILGKDKSFGSWLLELSENELDTFCDEIYFWDGSWTRKNNYGSNNKANTIWVQTILALRGKRAHFREYVTGNGKINYQVDVVDRDYSMTTNIQKNEVEYNGDVYCISVPSSYLLVRYKGEISVTGNCQNIPTAENDKHKIRKAFVAPTGKVLLVIDYAALEMRLLAAAAQAKDMIQIFLDEKDIHMGNAVLVFSDLYEKQYGKGFTYEDLKAAKKIDGEVKDGKRPESDRTEWIEKLLFARLAIKSIAFGLNYGMKERKMANDLGIPVAQALSIMNAYMDRLPTVKDFYASSIEACKTTLKSFTLLGRRRFLPEIRSNNTYERFKAERQAVNNEIQGTAAEVAKLAMINCDEAQLDYHYGADMLLQIHDELIFECPKETSKECLAEIKEWMEHPFPTYIGVPLTTSGNAGHSWAEAK